MARKIDTQNESLDVYVYMAKTFADTPWLHYGMWEFGDRVSVPNMRKAQERYVEFLLSFFPPAPKSVLDVGGGTGEMASLLTSKGYEVDMITPSGVQAEEADTKLPMERVHHCTFEAFETDRKFDVVLFSESFQYIPLDQSLPKSKSLLAPGGTIVIADCFRGENYNGELAPGSGHKITEFFETIGALGLNVARDEDVTDKVAPTMEIDQQFYRGFVSPLVTQIDGLLKRTRPIVHWFAGMGYKLFTSRDSRDRMQMRLKAEYRSPDNFRKANTYRFFALKAD
ncbi:MAG: class I SAM-dependent methyltransferase [Hyphomicrobiaceae bacterium]|nr:class I SAM-dependent methyltransferase [Hyphomicrobiaceae bacterium]MCC0024180.1 class I SAM-dependent methyltransferase [Hyphomicrobiaceae bacterium]